ncbi:MAG: helix-turn-helix transcriptional regulator [Bacilli bacterium]|jgi:DNA-binding XRE family transcriptional regulator|nr:helix-turn-helix transcriptional regulator [Bacilli bacterium]
MPTKHLNALCNYFNISVDYLFGFTNNKNYENSNNKISKTKTMLRLKELRKEYKISQSDLAESIGSAKTTISGYERGARIIATPFLYDICKKYKISADYLLGKTDIKDIL